MPLGKLKKKTQGTVVAKKTPTSSLERTMTDVTQYPKDTSGSVVSQLTRYETPMRQLVTRTKPVSKSFKTKKIK